MKSANVTRTSRPIKGQVAFVRVMATGWPSDCGMAAHPFVTSGFQLDRYEDRIHPGEGSA